VKRLRETCRGSRETVLSGHGRTQRSLCRFEAKVELGNGTRTDPRCASRRMVETVRSTEVPARIIPLAPPDTPHHHDCTHSEACTPPALCTPPAAAALQSSLAAPSRARPLCCPLPALSRSNATAHTSTCHDTPARKLHRRAHHELRPAARQHRNFLAPHELLPL
jgi:hypothetical protein